MAKHSKRIYTQMVNIKMNADGFKEQGITSTSKDSEMELLSDFYKECGVDRFSLGFVKVHGAGKCTLLHDHFIYSNLLFTISF